MLSVVLVVLRRRMISSINHSFLLFPVLSVDRRILTEELNNVMFVPALFSETLCKCELVIFGLKVINLWLRCR